VALSNANQNSCGTSVAQYAVNWVSTYNALAAVAVGGFGMSITTCLDYVTDEMSVNGTHILYGYNTGSLVTDATPLPATSMLGHAAGTG
jgi:dienelactone hydrolase